MGTLNNLTIACTTNEKYIPYTERFLQSIHINSPGCDIYVRFINCKSSSVVYNVLTADELQQKIDAFETYTDEIRPMPNPRNADGLCNYACQRGMECSADFAEAFMLLREINEI